MLVANEISDVFS